MNPNILWNAGPVSLTRFGILISAGMLVALCGALLVRLGRYRRMPVYMVFSCFSMLAVWGVICSALVNRVFEGIYTDTELSVGGVPVFLIAATGFALLAVFLLLLAIPKGRRTHPWAAVLCALSVLCVFAALFGGYLRGEAVPVEANIFRGGLSMLGVLVCLPPVFLLYGKNAGKLANCFAPGFIAFAMLAALGMRAVGEGWGKLTQADWIRNTFLSVPDRWDDTRFAVYRIEGICCLLFLIITTGQAMSLRRMRPWGGYVTAMALYCGMRVVTASMREGAVLHIDYFRVEQIGAMLVLIGICVCGIISAVHCGAPKSRWLCLVFLLAGAGLATWMEFAVDRDGGIEWKYLVMAAGSAVCVLSALCAGRRVRHMKNIDLEV